MNDVLQSMDSHFRVKMKEAPVIACDVDGFTSSTLQQHFMCLNGIFIDLSWKFHTVCLSTQSRIALNSDQLIESFNEQSSDWTIDEDSPKVSSIIYDGAKPNIKMGFRLEAEQGIRGMVCNDHLLNSMVRSFMKEATVQEQGTNVNVKVDSVVQEFRKICTHVHHSPSTFQMITEKWENMEGDLDTIYKFQQDVKTRFNSIYIMLDSVLR